MSGYQVTSPGLSSGERMGRMLVAIGLLPILLLLTVLVMSLIEPKFYGTFNVLNILRQSSFLAIVASGQMLVLIVGGLDLSVGAVVALTSCVMAKTMQSLGASYPDSATIVIIGGVGAGLGCGLGIGLLNGACVAFLRISPFMVTLGTLWIATGIGLLLTNGIPVYGMPDGFINDFGRGLWFGVPTTVYVALVVVFLVVLMQRKTLLGRYLFAIGGNAQAATVSGVATTGYIIAAYVLCSLLASMSGILQTARLGSGQATLGGDLLMLESIAAAVIGGASLRGGIGRAEMVALSAVFLSILSNSMNLLRIDSKMQLVILGLILVAAVAIDELGKRRQIRG